MVKAKVKLLSRVRLCDHMDYSLLGSSIHGIFQARVLEWVAIAFSCGFPYFFNLSLNLAVESLWSEPQSAPGLVFADCIVLPSLTAKNIINLISVLTIWWCPCVESSLVLLEEGVCYDQCILLAKLCLPLSCFILYSEAKFACYSRYLLTSYFCIPVPYDEKDIFFGY